MTEVDPSPSRLRRRSFFEGMDAAPSAAASSSGSSAGAGAAVGAGGVPGAAPEAADAPPDAVLLSERDLQSAAGEGAALLEAAGPSAAAAPSPADAAPSAARGGLLRALGRRLRAWLALQLQLWQLWLVARFPALARAAALGARVAARLRGAAARCGRGPRGGEGGSPVKHWAYPTRWLTLASLSLAALQLATLARWQALPLELRVRECAFRERALAASSSAAPPSKSAAAADALRFLERRFEQQHGPGVRAARLGRQRLPWACMAVVPSRADAPQELALARQLAFFWPRAEVLAPAAARRTASRLQLAVGAAPVVAPADGGVRAALFPLEAFRTGLFPARFPDLVLVKTEFAMRQMVRLRAERREDRAQRGGDQAIAMAHGLSNGRISDDVRDGYTDVATDGYKHAPNDHHDNGDDYADDRHAQVGDDLSGAHFGVYLLRTTVPDLFDRRERKDWDAFLHVVAVTERDGREQFTEELLALWLAHPAWPVLRVRFASSLALCASFQLLLSSLQAQADADAAEARGNGGDGLFQAGWEDDDLDQDKEDDAFDWDEPGRARGRLGRKKRKLNIDLVCGEEQNSRAEIARLKNAVGMHVFPVPPELEAYEELVLESMAVGAMVITYDTPVMQEWVPDAAGLRVGSFQVVAPAAADRAGQATEDGEVDGGDADVEGETDVDGGNGDGDGETAATAARGELKLPVVQVAPSEIEYAVERFLALDRANRVAAGRAARTHYLQMRTHYLSAVAALDAAICDDDSDEVGELPSEIGQNSRKKVEVETLRAFLY